MVHFKSFKGGYGIAVLLTLGLSSCYMQEQAPNQVDNAPQSAATTHTATTTKAAKPSYSAKAPAQKTTPGPKHTAAPPIPVIQ